jgi:hypothetical protein
MLLRQRQWKGEKQPAVPSDGVPAFGVCGYQIILGALTGNPRCIRGNLHDKLRLSLNHPRWRLGSRESGRLFFLFTSRIIGVAPESSIGFLASEVLNR